MWVVHPTSCPIDFAALRMGFSCASQPLTGRAEPQTFDATRLPGLVTPGWLVSAAGSYQAVRGAR